MACCTTVYGALAYITSSKTWTTSSPPVPRMAAPRICFVSASTQIFMKRAAWPVTRHYVLGLPGGVIGDQHDTADRLAVDLSDVVLEEAVVAVRASELVLLAVIQRADSEHD